MLSTYHASTHTVSFPQTLQHADKTTSWQPTLLLSFNSVIEFLINLCVFWLCIRENTPLCQLRNNAVMERWHSFKLFDIYVICYLLPAHTLCNKEGCQRWKKWPFYILHLWQRQSELTLDQVCMPTKRNDDKEANFAPIYHCKANASLISHSKRTAD